MLGRVKPYVPDLRVREYGLYKAVYCGLCRELGMRCGGGARLTLSYDFVFLTLCALAVNGERYSFTNRRCAVHPFNKRPVLDSCRALTYSAQAAAVLTLAKLRDDKSDERGFKRMTAAMCLPAAKRAVKRSDAPAKLTEAADELLAKLTAGEKAHSLTPDQAADIFGELLAVFFKGAADDETGARVMRECGFRCGRWIYFTDAADDLADDVKNKRYNAFAGLYGDGADAHADDIRNGCLCELARLRDAVGLLPCGDADVTALIENTVTLGMTAQNCKNNSSEANDENAIKESEDGQRPL